MRSIGHLLFDFVFKPVVSLIVGRAVLAVCHQNGWFPDQQLAQLLMGAPTALDSEMAVWLVAALIGGLLWLALHLALFGQVRPSPRA
jgi:hypothetical protein